MHVCMLSHYSWVQLFVTLWTVACQAPLFMGFSRQEFWSGLPSPTPGDLLNTEMEPRSPPSQADSLPSEPPGKPWILDWVAYPFSRALPDPGIGPVSSELQADSLPAELPGKPLETTTCIEIEALPLLSCGIWGSCLSISQFLLWYNKATYFKKMPWSP